MMFSTRSSVHVPLLGESQLGRHSDSSLDTPDDSPFLQEKQHRHKAAQTVPWTLILIVICTLLNIALSLFSWGSSSAQIRDDNTSTSDKYVTRQNVHLLRRPNQYIGFDEIPRPSPPVERRLTTYPILLSLVDSASPNTVFDDDVAAQMVRSGTITPDDRMVRATSSISTIIQFRAIDWGMETCELHVELPDRFGRPDAAQGGALALYRINATMPLDTAQLSYATRPTRIARVGNIPLGQGEDSVHWHRKFHCATDDVLSFELGCLPSSESGGMGPCEVEWMQIKDAVPAIHMVQHATV